VPFEVFLPLTLRMVAVSSLSEGFLMMSSFRLTTRLLSQNTGSIVALTAFTSSILMAHSGNRGT